MDRNQLIIAITITLLAAFVLGWLLGWVLARLGGAPADAAAEIDSLGRQLAQARGARDATETRAAAREAALTAALTTREADTTRLQDELNDARLEIDELRAYIDRQLNKG